MRCALGSLALVCLLVAGCGEGGPPASSGNTNPQTASGTGKEGETTDAAKAGEPTTLEITPASATITFVGTHAPPKEKDPRTGTFEKFSGKAVVDVPNKALKSLSVDIDMTAFKTFNDKLTNHLKSPDFLDVEQHPTARFESTKIEVGEDEAHTITGNLTLHGQKKEISVPAKATVGNYGMIINAEFEIDRMDFGVGDSDAGKGVERPVSIKVTLGRPSAAK